MVQLAVRSCPSDVERRSGSLLLCQEAQTVCSQHHCSPTQAARTTFVSPSDPTVVLALDTNIQMMKEVPFDVVVSDRCHCVATAVRAFAVSVGWVCKTTWLAHCSLLIRVHQPHCQDVLCARRTCRLGLVACMLQGAFSFES